MQTGEQCQQGKQQDQQPSDENIYFAFGMTETAFRKAVYEVLRAGHISGTEKDILLCIWGYARTGGKGAFPGHASIAKRLGKSLSTVKRGLQRLQSLGWITWERQWMTRGSRVHRSSNRYQLLVPPRPVDGYPHRRQVQIERRIDDKLKKKPKQDLEHWKGQFLAFGMSEEEATIKARIVLQKIANDRYQTPEEIRAYFARNKRSDQRNLVTNSL
jgi:hypothetical protein